MNIEYVGRVLARLQPFVRDHVIRRTRVDRVLGTLQSPPDGLLAEIERLFVKVGITIEDDRSLVADKPELIVEPEATASQEHSSLANRQSTPHGNDSDTVAAARQRMDRDRFIANHSRVLLTSEEEVGLALLVRGESRQSLAQGGFAVLAGEARVAAYCLLLHNQGLVHSVARKYTPAGMAYEDLVQHGMIGLIRAIELFDPSMGNKFSTYAMNWVRQSITRAIANESRMIRLPVHIYERVQKVWQTRAHLTVDGQQPTVHQLALACDLTHDQVKDCLLLGPQDILSLDTPVGPEGELTLGDLYDRADPEADPWQALEFVLLRDALTSVLDTLSEREAGVVSMRFGLTDGEPKTLDEIGKVYGVTRERIRQIEKQVMGKLQHESRSFVLHAYMYGPDAPPMYREDTNNDKASPVAE